MLPESKKKIYKAHQEVSRDLFLDYILLPYGDFYEKTRVILKARPGDTLRFFNGPDYSIENVLLLPCGVLCDYLCKMKYGVTWDKALRQWLRYARMEGHGDAILSKTHCILVFYDTGDTE